MVRGVLQLPPLTFPSENLHRSFLKARWAWQRGGNGSPQYNKSKDSTTQNNNNNKSTLRHRTVVGEGLWCRRMSSRWSTCELYLDIYTYLYGNLYTPHNNTHLPANLSFEPISVLASQLIPIEILEVNHRRILRHIPLAANHLIDSTPNNSATQMDDLLAEKKRKRNQQKLNSIKFKTVWQSVQWRSRCGQPHSRTRTHYYYLWLTLWLQSLCNVVCNLWICAPVNLIHLSLYVSSHAADACLLCTDKLISVIQPWHEQGEYPFFDNKKLSIFKLQHHYCRMCVCGERTAHVCKPRFHLARTHCRKSSGCLRREKLKIA